jgi:hypothetical protein
MSSWVPCSFENQNRKAQGKEESSFCEQKEAKKLFVHWRLVYVGRPVSRRPRVQGEKSFFGSFFQKKNCFLSCRLPVGEMNMARTRLCAPPQGAAGEAAIDSGAAAWSPAS